MLMIKSTTNPPKNLLSKKSTSILPIHLSVRGGKRKYVGKTFPGIGISGQEGEHTRGDGVWRYPQKKTQKLGGKRMDLYMVKGVAKRVIVVQSPDKRLFEEAIFIVKEEAFAKSGVTAEAVLKEAQQVARTYVKRNTGISRITSKIPPSAYAVGGALAATLAWSVALFV